MKRLFTCLFAATLALAGCASLNDPTTAFSGVVASFGGAVAAENLYLSSGKADPVLVKQIEAYRVATDKVLSPIEAEIAAGKAPSSDEVLAAQTATNALIAFLTAHNIQTGS